MASRTGRANYQIDFSAVAAGKHVASTKRRIRWRFGFPNQQALSEGRTGTDCRGEEHEVVIIWSITSGKRQILMDGKEVHFSNNRSGVLDQSWSTRGNHVVKVVCHASPPMSATPGFRQYDMFVDGQSFFTMPKVYELGLRGKVQDRVPGSRLAPRGGERYAAAPTSSTIRAPRTAREEEEDLQLAISASLKEAKEHLDKKAAESPPAPAPAPQPAFPPATVSAYAGDLMNVGGPEAAPAAQPFDTMSYVSAPPTQFYGAPAPAPYYPPTQPAAPVYQQPPVVNYGQPTPSYPTANANAAAYPALTAPGYEAAAPAAAGLYDASYGAAAPSYPPAAPAYAPESNSLIPQGPPPDVYGSAAPPTDPFALGAGYGAEDPFSPKAAPPPSHNQIASEIMSAYVATDVAPAMPVQPQQTTYQPGQLPTENGDALTASLNMMALTDTSEQEPENPFELAMKKLVNIDNIDQPAERQLKLTMEKEQQKQMMKDGKSKGLPPAAQNLVGSQATLSQISQAKPKKEMSATIMNAPPQLFSPEAAQAGMMVVYGQTAGPGQGPPPLPQGYYRPQGY